MQSQLNIIQFCIFQSKIIIQMKRSEMHFIFCQSSRLVGEEIMKSAKLFRNICVANGEPRKSLLVPNHADRVPNPRNIQIYSQRNGDNCGHENLESKHGNDGANRSHEMNGELLNHEENRENEQNEEAQNRDDVELAFDEGDFGRGALGVEGDARVDAGVDDEADRASRGDRAAGPERGVDVDADFDRFVFASADNVGGFEGVNVAMRRFDLEDYLGLGDLRRVHFERCFDRVPRFPIGLAVQLIGSDEARSRRLGCVKEDEIGGNSLAGIDFYNVADTNVFRFDRFEFAVGGVRFQPLVLGRIDEMILLPALDVVVALLEHGKRNDECKGREVGEHHTDLQDRDELRTSKREKVDVEDGETELVEKAKPPEREDAVATIVDNIFREESFDFAVRCQGSRVWAGDVVARIRNYKTAKCVCGPAVEEVIDVNFGLLSEGPRYCLSELIFVSSEEGSPVRQGFFFGMRRSSIISIIIWKSRSSNNLRSGWR